MMFLSKEYDTKDETLSFIDSLLKRYRMDINNNYTISLSYDKLTKKWITGLHGLPLRVRKDIKKM